MTATASAWDSLYNANTLEPATIVKLTRTLAIIPIVLFLSYWQSRQQGNNQGVKLKKIFPVFILYFILASLLTTLLTSFGVSTSFFSPLKQLSIFLIIMAMSAIGLKTNLIAMIKSSGKSILLGALCWKPHVFREATIIVAFRNTCGFSAHRYQRIGIRAW